MGLYNRFCKRFFAAVIVPTTAQADSRAGADVIRVHHSSSHDTIIKYRHLIYEKEFTKFSSIE